MESTAIQSRSESDWQGDPHEVRAIISFILAVALMASAAGVCAAEQSGSSPYTGPDTPVMTTG
jgi:hypothetical protein